MSSPIYISADFIENNTEYSELISLLQDGFASNRILVPPRHHHNFPNSEMQSTTTMLLMPSWQDSKDAGVKIVNVNPHNHQKGLPSIQGTYIYMDAVTGHVKAIMDAPSLTAKRTAAASALASSFLSSVDSAVMLMIGTGVLSTELIKAHSTIRPIQKAYVWGRNLSKAHHVKDRLADVAIEIDVCSDIPTGMSKADIISAATLSKVPLIRGQWLQSGQHIDLVGSYKPDMREADDEVVMKSDLYVDTRKMAPAESGDLCMPIESGVIKMEDIRGDLFDLCAGTVLGREDRQSITLFKSVGHALEDLIAARYYYQKLTDVNGI